MRSMVVGKNDVLSKLHPLHGTSCGPSSFHSHAMRGRINM